MRFTQLLAESLGAMLANPLRTLLTMLGIIIGIASVVLMLAVGDGIKAFINKAARGARQQPGAGAGGRAQVGGGEGCARAACRR